MVCEETKKNDIQLGAGMVKNKKAKEGLIACGSLGIRREMQQDDSDR